MKKSLRSAGVAGVAVCLGLAAVCQAPASAKDKMFLMKASEGGMTEVEFGKIAAMKAQSPDVKAFGQKMVDDHTMLLEKMKPFADKDGVTPPAQLSKAHLAEEAKLNSLSGDAFDKEYVTNMVKDHHMDVKDFTSERNTTKDPDLKATVSDGLGVIKTHTEMIDGIARKMGIATPSASSGM